MPQSPPEPIHPADHPMLDNAPWRALNTVHAHFAIGDDHARRYLPQVSPIVGMAHVGTAQSGEAGFAALRRIVAPGEMVGGFDLGPPYPPWELIFEGTAIQMIQAQPPDVAPLAPNLPEMEVVVLSTADAADMLDLVAIAQPGPFMPRTVEMGRYLGIRLGDDLIAMAGERTRLPGYTELSAICTHPDHVGKGLATHLVTRLIDSHVQQGIISFLHVDVNNTRAKGLYAHLGFVERRRFLVAAFQYTEGQEQP